MNDHRRKCEGLKDAEVVQLALGDLSYFACVYERYENRLILYIIKSSGCSREEAEDILQDAFIKVWKNLNAFDQRFPFSSWLYRIVHNESISYWRKNKNRKNLNLEMEASSTIISSLKDLADEPVSDPETKSQKVHLVLKKLKKEYREVLILKYFENMSYEEISDILRIPEGTVATRLNRAKRSFSLLSGGKIDSF